MKRKCGECTYHNGKGCETFWPAAKGSAEWESDCPDFKERERNENRKGNQAVK